MELVWSNYFHITGYQTQPLLSQTNAKGIFQPHKLSLS